MLDWNKYGKTLNTKEAAKFLGLRPHTLENWRTQGKGPPFHRHQGARGRIYYLEEALIAYRNERSYRSTSEY